MYYWKDSGLEGNLTIALIQVGVSALVAFIIYLWRLTCIGSLRPVVKQEPIPA